MVTITVNPYEEQLIKTVRTLSDAQRLELLGVMQRIAGTQSVGVTVAEFLDIREELSLLSDEEADQMLKDIEETFGKVEEIEVDFDE